MPKKIQRLETDVSLVGGGPAGCTIAKELSKKGKKVVLLEKGGDDDRFLGHGLGVFLRLEKGFSFPMPLKTTNEGDTIILAKCLGGGTLLYAGAASKPDLEYWKRHGIELPQELIDETVEECWVNLPPDDYIGQGTRRVWEAADGLGLPFGKQYRHIDFNKCRPGCEYCTNGCRKNAKWTAREFAYEAVENGTTLLTHTEATDIIIDNGVAAGVKAKGRGGQQYEINAKVVVLSAGGTHTSRLLQRSGFPEAGSWFCGDPTFFTFGFIKDGPGNGGEHNMAIGWHDEEHKVLFCSMISPYMSWHMQFLQDEPLKSLPRLNRFRKALGVFAKVSDDGVGKVASNGSISKTFTEGDQRRFVYSREINEKILLKAGCDPNDIHHSGFVMGHPSSTVKVGKMLDTDLKTSVENLYCCDTSVFPEAPGMPPVMTIVVLAKRLAQRLLTIV
jgi:choline dehydrogenase-like flavoprotein